MHNSVRTCGSSRILLLLFVIAVFRILFSLTMDLRHGDDGDVGENVRHLNQDVVVLGGLLPRNVGGNAHAITIDTVRDNIVSISINSDSMCVTTHISG